MIINFPITWFKTIICKKNYLDSRYLSFNLCLDFEIFSRPRHRESILNRWFFSQISLWSLYFMLGLNSKYIPQVMSWVDHNLSIRNIYGYTAFISRGVEGLYPLRKKFEPQREYGSGYGSKLFGGGPYPPGYALEGDHIFGSVLEYILSSIQPLIFSNRGQFMKMEDKMNLTEDRG